MTSLSVLNPFLAHVHADFRCVRWNSEGIIRDRVAFSVHYDIHNILMSGDLDASFNVLLCLLSAGGLSCVDWSFFKFQWWQLLMLL